LNTQEKEVTKIIQGDKNVLEAVSRFISTADTSIDACVDQTWPALSIDIEQIRALVLNSHKRGVRLRCITEITTNNIYYCKQLLNIVDELRHLDNIVGKISLAVELKDDSKSEVAGYWQHNIFNE
jgi:two-component system, OmpR family, sensor histidine kinase VicK